MRQNIRTAIGIVALLVAIIGFGVTLYLHGQDNSKIKAEKVARQAAAVAQEQSSKTTGKAIRLTLCPLVFAYVHPDPGTRSPTLKVTAGWHAVGALIGCPDGTG